MPTRAAQLPKAFRWLAERGRNDRAGGASLTVGTVAALLWANAAPDNYHRWWATVPSWATPLGLSFSLREWTNQALMLGFFLVIGLEMRSEVTAGELRTWRRAAVPVVAALVGMLVPAGLYALVIHGGRGSGGWGIPMATDVAFALGALAIVAAGRAPRLRIFLMALAVADDVASIIVLVCFYSRHVDNVALVVGAAAVAAMWALPAVGVTSQWIVLLAGAVSWWALALAGVEAAVVGVALGLLLPAAASNKPAQTGPREWERRLRPWVNLVVLPVFALANVGLSFASSGLATAPAVRILVAVLVARVIGKPLGIVTTAWIMTRRSSGWFGSGVPLRHLLGVGTVAAIGFTVPLLIIHAALPDGPLAAGATAGLLVASLVSALTGMALFRRQR